MREARPTGSRAPAELQPEARRGEDSVYDGVVAVGIGEFAAVVDVGSRGVVRDRGRCEMRSERE